MFNIQFFRQHNINKYNFAKILFQIIHKKLKYFHFKLLHYNCVLHTFNMKYVNKTHSFMIPLMLFMICVEVGIILAIYFPLINSDENEVSNSLNQMGKNIATSITNVVRSLRHNLDTINAVFEINGYYISKNNYIKYIQYDTLANVNIFGTLFYIAKIPSQNVTQFETFCNKHVSPNFTIKEINFTTGQFSPVSGREYYYPYVYGYPSFVGEEILFGYDFNSFPTTKYFVDIGTISPNITGSIRITLAVTSSTNNPYSYGIALLQTTTHFDENTNTSSVIGISVITVLIEKALNNGVNALNFTLSRDDVDVIVFDITDDGLANNKSLNISMLYKENKQKYNDIWFQEDIKNITDAKYMFNHTINFLDRTWVVYSIFNESYISSTRSKQYILLVTIAPVSFLILDFIILSIFASVVVLNYKNTELVESEKNKRILSNKMLSYFNHEIRNPLNIVKGMVDFLILDLLQITGVSDFNEIVEKDKTDTISLQTDKMITIISDCQTVSASCILMEHIVNDVLDIRKLEENKMDVKNVKIHLGEFMYQLQKTIKQKKDEHPQINFIVDVENDIKIIFLDKMRLTQILLNFLSNSFKFTIDGEIKVSIYRINSNIRFEVSDTGKGIEQENMCKLFNPFSQINIDDSQRHGGTGLGLYLCRKLAELMNGTTGCDSVFGKGSKFWAEFSNKIIVYDDPEIINIV